MRLKIVRSPLLGSGHSVMTSRQSVRTNYENDHSRSTIDNLGTIRVCRQTRLLSSEIPNSKVVPELAA
jgi:hypothetical protein